MLIQGDILLWIEGLEKTHEGVLNKLICVIAIIFILLIMIMNSN